MALPFAVEGLRQEDPVLVATTARNMELLRDALGSDADRIEYAESASFGRRPSQWADALRGHWMNGRPGGSTGAVRVIAEPCWEGRSRREIAAWHRMEAGLDVSLAGTGIWLVCPYDTRVVDSGIVEGAHRTHPQCAVGRRAEPSARFIVPEEFAGSHTAMQTLDSVTDLFRFEGDLVAVRRYVLNRAAPILVAETTVAMFDIAVGAVLDNLLNRGVDRVAVWVRPVAGRVLCTLHCDQPLDIRPYPDPRSPNPARLDDSLRMTDRLCEWLEISSGPSGCTIELAMAGQRLSRP